MTDTAAPAAGGAPGWEGGVIARLANLAGARVIAQGLGLAWFLYAARQLGAHEFGVLSTGLALVVIIGGLSDLGTTRTVVRHVAADPDSLRATFARAALVRIGAGAGLGLLVVAGLHVVEPEVPTTVAALAAAVAVASGMTEVGFAALRSTGWVGAEVSLLVGERVLFVIGGVTVVSRGGGPVAVLCVYAITNLVSALVVAFQIRRRGQDGGAPSGPLFDAEGRSTAVSSSLVIIGPRISVLILVVIATPTVLGTFTIAQKVPEALGILGTAALLPVLALLRSARDDDRWDQALARGSRITAAVAGGIAPVLVWMAIDGERFLDLLFRAGQRKGIVVALAFLSVAALLWVVRTLGEMVLLAEERASVYLRALGFGLVINVAVGIPLVERWGAAGAAGAALIGEVTVLLVVVAVQARPSVWVTPMLTVSGASAVAALVAVAGREVPVPVAMAAVAVVAAAAVALTARSLVGSAAPGDDADVRQEVARELAGDGIEAIEHGSGPTQHL